MAEDLRVIHLGLSPKAAKALMAGIDQGLDSDVFFETEEEDLLTDIFESLKEQLAKPYKSTTKKAEPKPKAKRRPKK
jgi:hypothetical protein